MAETTTQLTLPRDAQLVNNGFGVFAVFTVAPGVTIFYNVNWSDGSVAFDPTKVQRVPANYLTGLKAIDAGNAAELEGLQSNWGTYGNFWNSIINTVIGPSNPAINDPGVLRVVAMYAARPDMSMQELNNLLQATDWYRSRTESELAWNSLSPAEQQMRREEMASRMVQTWFQFTGESVETSDPRIVNYLEQVVSGKVGYGSWTESVVKKAALDNPESPYSRTLVDERRNQLQRGIDVENTSQRISDLARRWGVPMAIGTSQDWARQIVANEMSEADVLEAIKDQAQVMFPWKARDMDTTTAASPWLETYRRVMESEADLSTSKVQAALTAGTPVWQFEQQLKSSSDWLSTKNARQEMVGVVAEVGRRMGFQ